VDCRLTSTKMQTSSRHSSGRAGRTWKCALLTFCNMRYIHYFPPHVIQCFTTPAMLHNLCLPRLSVHCSLSAICNFFLPYSLCKGLVSQSIVKSYFARYGPSCRWKFFSCPVPMALDALLPMHGSGLQAGYSFKFHPCV